MVSCDVKDSLKELELNHCLYIVRLLFRKLRQRAGHFEDRFYVLNIKRVFSNFSSHILMLIHISVSY